MVYHSVPDPNKIYPHRMKNFETAKYDIQKVFYSADGALVDHVETLVTVYQIMKMDLTRDQLISAMKQQGSGIYYNERKLHLDYVSMIPYIHHLKSIELRDILE